MITSILANRISKVSTCHRIGLHLSLIRQIFSVTGIWDDELSTEMKMRIEKYWHGRVSIGTERHGNKNLMSKKGKFFVLAMFPYPSGNLHMGHVRVYSISDAIARCYRLLGYSVLHPIGWDAFGLPAENAAMERGENPKSWTYRNIAIMKEQLDTLGCSFDWNTEFATCDPSYYKWTQYLFLKLHENGLAYQKKAIVNWDPIDKTVLADEQVDSNGISWRSGAKVEKKPLRQWFLRTTHFSESLWNGLQSSVLENWRDVVKIQQHWIGDCNGSSFEFKIKENQLMLEDCLSVWTKTPEFIFGVTFIALSPEHILSKSYSSLRNEERNDFLLDIVAVHPFTNKDIPIFVSRSISYPLEANAYLGIPGEIEEDKSFAERHNLPVIKMTHMIGQELILQESDEFSGMKIQDAQNGILEKAKKMKVGGHLSSSKLRDWLISRQRHWGTPIPIIHCEKCKSVPVPYDDLPVELPQNNADLEPNSRILPLNLMQEWINVTCPKCGGQAHRETDTMDTFVDSSWYYLRFTDSNNRLEPFSKKAVDSSMPVDFYIGGKEHAAMHLYYARFLNHFCYAIGLVRHQEPFKRLLVQGMVMGETFYIKESGKYLRRDEITKEGDNFIEKETGAKVNMQWEKMSKSRHNGVDPKYKIVAFLLRKATIPFGKNGSGEMEVFNTYGVDTTRLFILADVAPTSNRNWSSSTFPGILGWQNRLWITISEFRKHRSSADPPKSDDQNFLEQEAYMFDSRNFYIKGVTHNFCRTYQISVAISKMQGLTNSIRRMSAVTIAHGQQFERALAAQIIMLSPLAPHFASELWAGFVDAAGKFATEITWDGDVFSQSWPDIDETYNLKLVYKINNEDVSEIKMPRKQLDILTEASALEMVNQNPQIKQYIDKHLYLSFNFKLIPGHEAELNFTIPELDLRQKKKKKTS